MEKALEGAVEARRRLPSPEGPAGGSPLHGLRCLVIGAGPVGLLASMALTLRGARPWCLDVLDEKSVRPGWLAAIGVGYMDGRKVKPARVHEAAGGRFGLIFQASGAPGAAFGLIPSLAEGGVFVFFASGRGRIRADASLITGIIDGNQTLMGSISSAGHHFTMALDDLAHAELKWPGHAAALVTDAYRPAEFRKAYRLDPSKSIKTVIDWS